jgi:RimJ/RimL family protein N-acetyltransferase
VSRSEQQAVLRRLAPKDRDSYVALNRDRGVRKYFPGLLTPEESLGEMTHIEQHWDAHGFGPWALDVRGEFAGILGLMRVPSEMPFAPAVELLFRLVPHFWGQGLATEGSVAALKFGFLKLHLDAVIAFAVEANTASRKVMEKVGMNYVGDFDHPSMAEVSPLRRHVLYSLKRSNWHEKSSPIRIVV